MVGGRMKTLYPGIPNLLMGWSSPILSRLHQCTHRCLISNHSTLMHTTRGWDQLQVATRHPGVQLIWHSNSSNSPTCLLNTSLVTVAEISSNYYKRNKTLPTYLPQWAAVIVKIFLNQQQVITLVFLSV